MNTTASTYSPEISGSSPLDQMPRTGDGARTSSVDPAAAVDRIATGAHQAVDRIANAASSAASQLNVKSEDLLAAKDRWMETCTTYVKEKPFVALGIAAAAGFLLSRWMR